MNASARGALSSRACLIIIWCTGDYLVRPEALGAISEQILDSITSMTLAIPPDKII